MEVNDKYRPPVYVTLLMLVGVVVFMAGLLGAYALTGVGQPAFGFIFLVYWAAILQQAPKAYVETIVGGIAGIVFAALLDRSMAFNAAVMVLQYLAIAAILFFYMRRQFGFVINNSLMLYMTVSSMPTINPLKNYVMLIESLLVGALYMGAVSLMAHRFRSWSADRGRRLPIEGVARSDF